ncbi:hypothetical protein IJ596_03030 [bacterium]|nr:hypothetical protein [bacterium]
MKKKIYIFLAILLTLNFSGCSQSSKVTNSSEDVTIGVSEEIISEENLSEENSSEDVTIGVSGEIISEENLSEEKTENKAEIPEFIEVDDYAELYNNLSNDYKGYFGQGYILELQTKQIVDHYKYSNSFSEAIGQPPDKFYYIECTDSYNNNYYLWIPYELYEELNIRTVGKGERVGKIKCKAEFYPNLLNNLSVHEEPMFILDFKLLEVIDFETEQ